MQPLDLTKSVVGRLISRVMLYGSVFNDFNRPNNVCTGFWCFMFGFFVIIPVCVIFGYAITAVLLEPIAVTIMTALTGYKFGFFFSGGLFAYGLGIGIYAVVSAIVALVWLFSTDAGEKLRNSTVVPVGSAIRQSAPVDGSINVIRRIYDAMHDKFCLPLNHD